ncbi:potassium voltage-gated channel subfamily KQT member 3 [Lates japonicus]|uniref:Potassium voltage-gated channel subfamily KQT member 3 n=1 Tax=Lates japonicus TaxID=270547 RepID=A0AAD3MB60_LATJO|nr:potassium voltage-gated channel subfamily KQT member 3 [Lates japonicus]
MIRRFRDETAGTRRIVLPPPHDCNVRGAQSSNLQPPPRLFASGLSLQKNDAVRLRLRQVEQRSFTLVLSVRFSVLNL